MFVQAIFKENLSIPQYYVLKKPRITLLIKSVPWIRVGAHFMVPDYGPLLYVIMDFMVLP